VVALREGRCWTGAKVQPSSPPAVHGFQSPEPSPLYKEENCTRGLRSFVDVLDSLM
jgi:hypothetical protein